MKGVETVLLAYAAEQAELAHVAETAAAAAHDPPKQAAALALRQLAGDGTPRQQGARWAWCGRGAAGMHAGGRMQARTWGQGRLSRESLPNLWCTQ